MQRFRLFTAKVTGKPSYVHDMVLPGMLHGRVVRPPSYDARLLSIDDEAGLRALLEQA